MLQEDQEDVLNRAFQAVVLVGFCFTKKYIPAKQCA